jgi:hypothetical protein
LTILIGELDDWTPVPPCTAMVKAATTARLGQLLRKMPDECVETAYFGENFPVLEYLRGIVPSTNPFLAQKITQDGNVNYYRAVNGIEGN